MIDRLYNIKQLNVIHQFHSFKDVNDLSVDHDAQLDRILFKIRSFFKKKRH